MSSIRDWLCYQIVTRWPHWPWLNPLWSGAWTQRAAWWVHMRALPHAGSWAYRDEIRAAKGAGDG
jgi:hypothetical protein